MMALQFRDVSYTYPASSAPSLCDLNISFSRGGFHVVSGPRGSGKSTLLRLARGFWKEYGGELIGDITLLGRSILNRSISELGAEIAIVFQNPAHQMHQLRVIDELVSAPSYQGLDWEECESRAFKLARLARLEKLLPRNPDRLSSGEQQRVAVAAALTMDAEVLLVDEPISFLDTKMGTEILGLIAAFHERGNTVVLATHDVQRVAKMADSVALLNKGRLVSVGPPRRILYSRLTHDLIGSSLLIDTASKLLATGVLRKRVMDWGELGKMLRIDQETQTNMSQRAPERNGSGAPLAAIEMEGVSFGYEPGRQILNKMDLAIRDGGIFGLVGSSGSGKTTISKLLVGLLRPASGKVWVKGRDLVQLNRNDLSRLVGYVFQNPTEMLLTQSVEDECRLGRRALRLPDAEAQIEGLLTRFGLQGLRKRNPFSLSGGQQRLLTIAAVLSAGPKIIVLDEPDFGLDMKSWGKVKRSLKALAKEGHTIVLVTHNLEETLLFCDRIAVIAEGRVLGIAPPFEILSNRALLAKADLGDVPISSIVTKISASGGPSWGKVRFRKALAMSMKLPNAH